MSVLVSLYAVIWPQKHSETDVTCLAGAEQSLPRRRKESLEEGYRDAAHLVESLLST